MGPTRCRSHVLLPLCAAPAIPPLSRIPAGRVLPLPSVLYAPQDLLCLANIRAPAAARPHVSGPAWRPPAAQTPEIAENEAAPWQLQQLQIHTEIGGSTHREPVRQCEAMQENAQTPETAGNAAAPWQLQEHVPTLLPTEHASVKRPLLQPQLHTVVSASQSGPQGGECVPLAVKQGISRPAPLNLQYIMRPQQWQAQQRYSMGSGTQHSQQTAAVQHTWYFGCKISNNRHCA